MSDEATAFFCDIINQYAKYDQRKQLRLINTSINNNFAFTQDIKDEWLTPEEFFDKGGDCEDFAITKYVILRKMGFTQDQLRICYCKLVSGESEVAHMVLFYYYGDEILVLDNLINSVYSKEQRTDIKEVYTFNESELFIGNILRKELPTIVMSKWKNIIDSGVLQNVA